MYKHTKEYLDIALLLYKKHSGLLTEEEKMILDEWKGSSVENQDIYNRLSTELDVDKKKEQYRSINSSKVWKKIESRLDGDKISVSKPKKRNLFIPILKYAAVFVLPLAVGGILLYNGLTTIPESEDVVAECIVPGAKKAMLVLESGRVVDLEEKKDTIIEMETWGRLSNQNNRLAYEPTSSSLKKIEIKWHRLVVPKGGEYQLYLADGTKVYLNSDSELRYTNRFEGSQRVVYLKGEACFDVSEDKARPFVVKTNAMDVRVYGTVFNVMDYGEEEFVHTTLVEGSVQVDLKNETGVVEQVMLKPNMQVGYVRGGTKGIVKAVDARFYTGWKDGLFQFNDEDLGSILRKLARWYNVNVFFQNTHIQNIRFTGELKRMDDFSNVLKLLELGSGVDFQVKGNILIVREVK